MWCQASSAAPQSSGATPGSSDRLIRGYLQLNVSVCVGQCVSVNGGRMTFGDSVLGLVALEALGFRFASCILHLGSVIGELYEWHHGGGCLDGPRWWANPATP